jgi:hypothetical protein
MGLAVALGTGAMALVLLLTRALIAGAGEGGEPDPFATPGMVLLLGTGAACLLAFVTVWLLLRPIGNPYRQGGLASVAGLVTLVVGFLAAPVHYYLGARGLAAVVGVAALAALAFARRLRRMPGP